MLAADDVQQFLNRQCTTAAPAAAAATTTTTTTTEAIGNQTSTNLIDTIEYEIFQSWKECGV
eukprot:scaffold23464_cov126-Cylindrotheca_fusiformis.AAC.2